MTTALYRRQGEQFFDASGKVLAGGILTYYRSGTTTPLTTYSEQTGVTANSNPILLNTAGRLITPVFLGDVYDYTELLTDANGVTISPWPVNGIPKAVATNQVQTGFERLYLPWSTATHSSSPVALLGANAGAAYEADATSGNIIFNLPLLSSIDNGKGYYFKRIDASTYTVTVTPQSGEYIDGANASIIVPSGYNGVMLISDGAQWMSVCFYSPISRLVGVAQSISAGTSLVIDLNLGWYVKLAVTASISSFSVQHCPASGTLVKVVLDISNGGAFTLTGWPGTVKWPGGSAPTLTSSGKDVIMLTSTDGGANWLGYVVAQSMS